MKRPCRMRGTGHPMPARAPEAHKHAAGGREMNLLDFGLRVLAIVGLGMAPLVDQSLVLPGRGEMPQGTGTTAREFTLVSQIIG